MELEHFGRPRVEIQIFFKKADFFRPVLREFRLPSESTRCRFAIINGPLVPTNKCYESLISARVNTTHPYRYPRERCWFAHDVPRHSSDQALQPFSRHLVTITLRERPSRNHSCVPTVKLHDHQGRPADCLSDGALSVSPSSLSLSPIW